MKNLWPTRIQIALCVNFFLLANAVAGDWWIAVSGLEWGSNYPLAIHTTALNTKDQLITASFCLPPEKETQFQSIEKCIVPPGKRVYQVSLYQAGIDTCRQWEGIDSFSFPQSLAKNLEEAESIDRFVNLNIRNEIDSAEHPLSSAHYYWQAYNGENVSGHWDPCSPVRLHGQAIKQVNSLRVEESLSLLVKPKQNLEVYFTPGSGNPPAIGRFSTYLTQKMLLPNWIRNEFRVQYLPKTGSFPSKNEYYSAPQSAGDVKTVRRLLGGRGM